MQAIKRLLIPTDFSDGSTQAAAYAQDIMQQFDAEIHVLHVLEPMIIPPFPGEALPASFNSERNRFAQQEMMEWLSTVKLNDSNVKTATVHGSPHGEIVQYAQDHDIDLIVMGTHGRTGLSHSIIGSVAERVVRTAHCPVLTVRTKAS